MDKIQIIRTLDGAVYTLNPVSTLSPTTSTALSHSTSSSNSETVLAQKHTLSSSATFSSIYSTTFPTNWAPSGETNFSSDSVPSKNTLLIIGLSVGLSIGLFLLFFLGYFAFYRSTTIKSRIRWLTRRYKSPDHKLQTDDTFQTIEQNLDKDGKIHCPYGNPYAHSDDLTMSFKISKVIRSSFHVKTPSQTYASNSFRKHEDEAPSRRQPLGDSQTKLVDRFLYSKPPRLCHISSQLHSKNSSLESVESLGNLKKWNYSSPLSKWFLRSSTYLVQSNSASPQNGSEDERSSVLNNTKIPKLFNNKNGTFSRINKKLSVIKDIQPKTKFKLERIDGDTFCEVKRKKQLGMLKNLEMKQTFSRLSKHLDEIALCKPLFSEPSKKHKATEHNEQTLKNVRTSTYGETLTMYEVTREYKPRLFDELYIIPGEYITVLATHTDGWCLVERANYFERMTSNIDGKDYLNSNRGIVPMECLEQI